MKHTGFKIQIKGKSDDNIDKVYDLIFGLGYSWAGCAYHKPDGNTPAPNQDGYLHCWEDGAGRWISSNPYYSVENAQAIEIVG